MTTIAISAVSSFTGTWIARALREAGYEVLGLATKPDLASYSGLPRLRLELAQQAGVKLHFSVASDDGSMTAWIKQNRFSYWIHHHHFMESFRSPDYDTAKAHQVGIAPLAEIVQALRSSQVSGILYSGTYIESTPSPYGRSKLEVWQTLRDLARAHDLALGKITIANPIGPLENEDRVIPMLIRASQAGETFAMRSPDALNYPVPVTVLSAAYIRAIKALEHGETPLFEPSLGAWTNRELAEATRSELIHQRLHLKPCAIEYGTVAAPTAVTFREANEICDWPGFWDFYAEHFSQAFLRDSK